MRYIKLLTFIAILMGCSESNIEESRSLSTTNSNNREFKELKDSLVSKEKQILRLEDELKNLNSEFLGFKTMLEDDMPLIISDVEVANGNGADFYQTDFGEKIYSEKTMFLIPRITFLGVKNGSITLSVKFYTNANILSTSENSPSGFTYEQTIDVKPNEEQTVELKGWGSRDVGQWSKGTYRFEIWYDDVCLKSKSVVVY